MDNRGIDSLTIVYRILTAMTQQMTIRKPQHQRLSVRQKAMVSALEKKQFFKLIGGGSFTEEQTLEQLATIYTAAGCDCIDIAPDLDVIEAVDKGIASVNLRKLDPVVMVSLPLDPDPHFRKIDLIEDSCILCNACVPICPTEALLDTSHNPASFGLEIDQPLCYGCSRCVDVCPTEALKLHPFLQQERIQEVLDHPLVEAVEIHTSHIDPYVLTSFLDQYGSLLSNKLIALCFRPESAPTEQWLQFIAVMNNWLDDTNGFPLILQIDGKPMSGSGDPGASLSSLRAAKMVYPYVGDNTPFITISGGINQYTADYLKQDEYRFISGVGMGTVARKWVWQGLKKASSSSGSINAARQLIKSFSQQSDKRSIKTCL